MAHARTASIAVDDLSILLPDWRIHLRARNVAPSTIASYLRVGENLLAWLTEAGMPTTASGIAREHLEGFLAALTERVSPATVAKHYRSMQQLFRWLVEDGEIPRPPMERMRPPAVPSSRSTSSATTNCVPYSTLAAATPLRTVATWRSCVC